MLKVMIAEDDLLMADMLEDVLVDGGYEVCGIARTVDKAVELCEQHKPDLAILDLRLAEGGFGTEIAARLNRQGQLGVLYATATASQAKLTKADGEACISKPYRSEDVLHALKIVKQIISTGEASQPFPKGFRLLIDPTNAGPDADPRMAEMIRQITRLHRQQAELARFGSFAIGEHDLGKVLTEAARVCAECLEVAFCKICRYRFETNDLFVEAGVGWNVGVVGHVVSSADETTPQGRAFLSGEPVICYDLKKDAQFLLPSFYAEHGIVSTVDVIIHREGQSYGVLEIDSPVQHDYNAHDVAFLTGFANVLAEAVETSKRNAETLDSVERMKDMVADRDRLLAAKSVLLDEKNVLAQELQHRVRNNLQLIYGMIRTEIRHAEEGAGTGGFSAIARRVMTLAEVYDNLLGTGLSRTIDFGGYLSSLCSGFEALQKTERPNVTLTCHWEPIMLDLDTVTTLGLIISELISNSYAHAFPDGTGNISVSLTRGESDAEATLAFEDDGVGYSETAVGKRRGLGLVKRLMEQVSGLAVATSDRGTEWALTFPIPTTPLAATLLASESIPSPSLVPS